MYNNSAYWNNTRQAIRDTSHDLFVTSCGHYRLITKEVLPTNRPKGRSDFQAIFIASGKGFFYFNKNKTTINAGSLVFYFPKEEQRYYYYLKDSPDVYWVHFTGKNARSILKDYNINKEHRIIHLGTNLDLILVYQKMIQELLHKKNGYEEMLSLLLKQILILSLRTPMHHVNGKSNKIYALIDESIEYFNEHYAEDINIDNHAMSLGFTTSWYIRKFKEITGTTPMQYILNIRIDISKGLLLNTDYTIAEIGYLVGFHNPLYFSRHFKQKLGLSPKEYRNKWS